MKAILNFSYALKSVSSKDFGSIGSSQHYSLKILFIVASFSESTGIVHLGIVHRQACVCILFLLFLLDKYFRACTNFLEMYGK